MGVVNVVLGKQDKIFLGNLNAKEIGVMQKTIASYVENFTIQKTRRWVIATGKSYSIKDLLTLSFSYFKINIKFLGKG